MQKNVKKNLHISKKSSTFAPSFKTNEVKNLGEDLKTTQPGHKMQSQPKCDLLTGERPAHLKGNKNKNKTK